MRLESFDDTDNGSFTTPEHEYPSYLELRLTATDTSGSQDIKSVRLNPQTVELTFHSYPSGLQLTVGSTADTTPFSRTVIVGSKNSVSALSPQSLESAIYSFDSWSDREAQSQDIVAGAEPSIHTATYTLDTVPTISALNPASGSRLSNRKPTIRATVQDKQTDLTKSAVTLVVDGQTIAASSFTYDEARARLSYTPATKMTLGKHTVEVTARDVQGLVKTRTWSFKVR